MADPISLRCAVFTISSRRSAEDDSSGDLLADCLEVAQVDTDLPAGPHAAIRGAGGTGPHDDEIPHVRPEVVVHAVLKAATRA